MNLNSASHPLRDWQIAKERITKCETQRGNGHSRENPDNKLANQLHLPEHVTEDFCFILMWKWV
jgi:hypothetical protein